MTTRLTLPALRSDTSGEPHADFSSAASLQRAKASADLLKLLETLDHQASRADAALEAVAASFTANATNAQFFYQAGLALRERRQHEHAARHFQRAIEIQPEFVAAYLALASIHCTQGRYGEAEATLRTILELQPTSATLHAEFAAVMEAQEQLDRAVRHLILAVELDPAMAGAWFRLGGILQQQGETAEARHCFRQGVESQPADAQTRLVRSLVALQLGDFARGWEDFDLRLTPGRQTSSPAAAEEPTQTQLTWDEERLARQCVLVRSEGNLVDDIMFASCLVDFARLARHCVVQCDAALAPLLERSFPTIEVERRAAGTGAANAKDFDAEIHLGSLPRCLRGSLHDFPAQRAYLAADARRTRYWRDRLRAMGPGLKVGLAWSCPRNVGQTVEPAPSLHGWAEVLRVPGVQFINLDRRRGAADSAETRDQTAAEVHELLISGRYELDDVAALISALDLVIAAPNTVAHLAGALGADVWVPLACWPSWRWGLEGETCAWYPTMRLFRQRRRGSWDELFAGIAAHLRHAEAATCRGR
jgi:tetratricopeptide (TPR) repeat protein